jgi:hypothetical protein
MEFTVGTEAGVVFVEGIPDTPFMAQASDVDRLIEACFSEGAHAALLYGANVPSAFFDLSSGVAGAILQKLRHYHIRLALVCPPGSVTYSSRFGEMVDDERRGREFGLFEAREEALGWIGR